MKTKILFLLKKNSSYGSYSQIKNSGLTNATNILKKELERVYDADIYIEICVDANEIDKFVTIHKPEFCILEAIWVTPTKMKEIAYLHRKVRFITRVHSRIPFLALEGNAIQWLTEISKIKNCFIAANHNITVNDLNGIDIETFYLPNVYKRIKNTSSFYHNNLDCFYDNIFIKGKTIDIGCFGSIRPLKNQLIQAVAAVIFADKFKLKLNFHINGGRIEQSGESVLKNIRALFANSKHNLIEHGWLEPKEFNELASQMDVGLQVSFTESFNIVAADMIYNNVPVVVSNEISWVADVSKVDPNSVYEIVEDIERVCRFRKKVIEQNLVRLDKYNKTSLRAWKIMF